MAVLTKIAIASNQPLRETLCKIKKPAQQMLHRLESKAIPQGI
jgi:hypothetical protein